jgi:UDP-N-acetylmuramoyl-tripeptide--D-alanyl-D-alanine ligase
VLVAEMGMRGLGQIADLCEVARPELAVVTSIGPEHLELLGSVEAVARANAEAIGALPEGGIAVVPAGCHELEPYLRADVDVRTFDPNTVARAGSRWRFPLRDAVIELELPFTQRHLAENVLAALVAYDALGLPLERLEEGASKIRLSQWRGEVLELAGGGFVVNDAYNANPTSMRAALLDLAERGEGRRRVAILGEMAELGVESDRYHAEVAELVATHVDLLITVGARARAYAVAGGAVAYEAATVADVPDVVEPGDAVLVKASRSVGLEGLAPLLAKNVARRWEATT